MDQSNLILFQCLRQTTFLRGNRTHCAVEVLEDQTLTKLLWLCISVNYHVIERYTLNMFVFNQISISMSYIRKNVPEMFILCHNKLVLGALPSWTCFDLLWNDRKLAFGGNGYYIQLDFIAYFNILNPTQNFNSTIFLYQKSTHAHHHFRQCQVNFLWSIATFSLVSLFLSQSGSHVKNMSISPLLSNERNQIYFVETQLSLFLNHCFCIVALFSW